MKKNNKILLLMALFFLQLLLSVSYFDFQEVKQMHISVANRLYSPQKQEVGWSGEWEKVANNLENGRIFFELDSRGMIRVVYQKDRWKPPLISGSFFNTDTYSPQAVIGSALQHLVVDGLIEIEGSHFEVTGTMGVDFPSPIDYLVLLNQFPSSYFIYRTIIDGNSADLTGSFYRIGQPGNSVSRLWDENFFSHLIEINFLLINSLLLVTIGFLFATLFKDRDYLCYQLGKTKLVIFIENVAALIGIFFIPLFFVWMFGLLQGNSHLILQQWQLFFIALSISIISYFVVSLGMLRRRLR